MHFALTSSAGGKYGEINKIKIHVFFRPKNLEVSEKMRIFAAYFFG